MIRRDKDTFLAIIETHKMIIFKICNMYCNNTEDKKDLVQEVIFQLWKSFPRYDETFKISTWMYRITLNVSISNYRKLSTRRKHFDPMNDGNMAVAVEETQDMEEQTHLLRQMINQLNEVNKAIIILYLEERINRIKKTLKEQFKSLV